MIDSLTRGYLGWCLRHPAEAAFRIVRWMNIDADKQQRIMLYNSVMGLPDRVASLFAEELAYLESKGEIDIFPYDAVRERPPVETGVEGGYSYVMHDGLRLYYPKGVMPQEAEAEYCTLVNDEGILGSGVRRCSPHSYVSPDFVMWSLIPLSLMSARRKVCLP